MYEKGIKGTSMKDPAIHNIVIGEKVQIQVLIQVLVQIQIQIQNQIQIQVQVSVCTYLSLHLT